MSSGQVTNHFSISLPDDPDLQGGYGSYEPDVDYGFKGKIFLPNYKMSGPGFLDVPDGLDLDLFTVVTERGAYATLCFPQFSRRNWNNLSVLSIEFRFKYIIEDLKIDSTENCVESVEVVSPTIASILGVHPVEQIYSADFANGGAKFNLSEPHEFVGKKYDISIGANSRQGSSGDGSEVYFRADAALVLRFREPTNFHAALEHVRMLDDLLSVMSGSYAALKSVAIKVSIPTADDSSPRKFAVLGYGTGFQIADFVYWHDVIAKATIEVDWASLVETFQLVWKESKIPFKWFRSSQVNKRYIEEKFAYVIRISELYFKPENVVDSEGEIILSKITAALEGDRDTLAAVAKRIAPILRGSPSLVATLRAIAAKYPELAIWADYNPKDIARLRGKEMHGSDAHYSGDEYRCMYDASLGLLLAFRLDVLSKCGFDRAQLIESSPKSQHVRRLIKRQVNTPDQPT